jgi:hypothetical protein
MEQKKKVIKVTKVGKGLNVGYDDVYFLSAVMPNNNGYMDIELTSDVLSAMMFNEDETSDMFGDIMTFVMAIIRNNIIYGRYEGRVSDYKVEVATLKLSI